MSKSLKIAALGLVTSASALSVAGHAEAKATKGSAKACLYKYVVTDGKPNNVITYKSPRGNARQGSIRPNATFVVYFGTSAGKPNHVGSRQLTERGWVTFPRPYLKSQNRCQSFNEASSTASAAAEAAANAVRDIGKALGDAARGR